MHPDCPDYDLCEKCECSPFPVHPETHPMLKTKVPLRIDAQTVLDSADVIPTRRASKAFETFRQARTNRATPVAVECVIPPSTVQGPNQPTPLTAPAMEPKAEDEPRVPGGYVVKEMSETKEKSFDPLICGTAASHVAVSATNAHNVTPLPAALSEEKTDVDSAVNKLEAMSIVEAVEPEANVHVAVVNERVEPKQPLTQVAKSPSVPPTLAVTPLDVCSWVRHQTMGPGSALPAGAEFTKTWRMKHFANGSEYDFNELRLVLKSRGDCGEACENVNVVLKKDDIKNDDEIEVSIHGLRVPDTPGQEIVEQWRFEDENGVQYGQPLRLRSVPLFIGWVPS